MIQNIPSPDIKIKENETVRESPKKYDKLNEHTEIRACINVIYVILIAFIHTHRKQQ